MKQTKQVSAKKPYKRASAQAALIATCAFSVFTHQALAGPATGGASEWTQLMNNAELVALVGQETQNVALNSEQLLTQVETLRTQLAAYQNMVQNTLNLPDTIWRDVEGSLMELHGAMSEAQSLAFDGGKLQVANASDIGQQVQKHHAGRAEDVGTREHALRVTNFPADKPGIRPTVVGPQHGDQGEAKGS